MLSDNLRRIEDALMGVYQLALRDTPVGTGINAALGFAVTVASEITKFAGLPQSNRKRISEYVNRSLMLVTALAPVIGYDKASKIAHHASEHDLTLKQAARALGIVDEPTFDRPSQGDEAVCRSNLTQTARRRCSWRLWIWERLRELSRSPCSGHT